MKRIAEAKQMYDSIPIPKELSERVMAEVEKAGVRRNKKMAARRRYSMMKKTAAAAAAVAVVALGSLGLNHSTAFAEEMRGIPVIGSRARVLNVFSYQTETDSAGISVDVPGIEMISQEIKGMEKEVNREIYSFCRQYADEALAGAEEYRQAFLATGGTEEEWLEHNISIKVWYEVKTLTDKYLSLVVMGSTNWNNAQNEAKYYTFDVNAGRWITLTDLLSAEEQQAAKKDILSQMEQRERETGMEFWKEEWEGIEEDTKFYVNHAGNPVIVFERYEIAPGAAGQQEFEIAR